MNPESGRFLSLDSYAGAQNDPLSLHKYLYANGNPVSNVDPSGFNSMTLQDLAAVGLLVTALATVALLQTARIKENVRDRVSSPWDAIPISNPLERVSPFPQPSPQPSPSPVSRPEPHPVGEGENQMRVQLQEGDSRERTYGIVRRARPEQGVSVRQMRDALQQLYEDIPNKAPWFPLDKLFNEFYNGVVYLSQRLGTFPPGGIIQGGQIKGMRYEIPDGRMLYRIDIENLRGHNLRY